MKTCSKRYTDFPFAHRSPRHDGHCRFIHGHNWTFDITFAADATDENGFVVDFGKLHDLREALVHHFDHTLLVNRDDPMRDELEALLDANGICNLITVDDCSCEGIARLVFDITRTIITALTDERARVVSVTVYEDSNNSATWSASQKSSGQ
jgi:6-pyruvoyltetrahydropterin/6-carboxytetrahydropterin synthase